MCSSDLDFVDADYEHEVELVMVFGGGTIEESAVDVERVPYEDVAPDVEAAWRRHLPSATDDEIRQLVERRATYEAVCHMSDHVVRRDGRCVARCEMSRLDGVAAIGAVMTDPGHEGQGFAQAVVLDAVRLARESCDVIFLEADPADWPRQLYRRLGFSVIGYSHSFRKATD